MFPRHCPVGHGECSRRYLWCWRLHRWCWSLLLIVTRASKLAWHNPVLLSNNCFTVNPLTGWVIGSHRVALNLGKRKSMWSSTWTVCALRPIVAVSWLHKFLPRHVAEPFAHVSASHSLLRLEVKHSFKQDSWNTGIFRQNAFTHRSICSLYLSRS